MIGETHGHYHITERLGAGGMGEVYRATDTKLKRDVAIKVLPEEVAKDPERLARFQREAELLASLNHPHIAAIHGIEEADGVPLLILELVEGEDLSTRLERGAVPPDEVLEIARQVAEALEEAHEHGVVHRDLKPANVKITPEGKIKVLDFGLAKAQEADESEGLSGDVSRSPTLAYSGTQAGVILGTAAYMSPEQARGKVVDRRADIWACGVVLYEMLVGGQLFGGETATDIIASVVKEQPDWERLPKDTPPVLRSLLRRCLVKDPRQRLRDMGDARIEIERALTGGEGDIASAVGVEPTPPGRRWVPWAVAAVLGVALIGAIVAAVRSPASPVLRFDVPAPEGRPFALNPGGPGPVRVSPDGRMLAYAVLTAEGEGQLYVRALDEASARALPGTEGARYPFWSPDSRHIGFFADGKLKRIEAAGGPPLALSDAQWAKGGSWTRDGVILFAPGAATPLHQVSDTGGESRPVTVLDETRQESSHRHPRALPGGRTFLYMARHRAGAQDGELILAAPLDGGEPKVLMRAPAAVEYAAGHLFFVRDTTLMVQPFDAERLELTGEARPLVEPVAVLGDAHAVFSVSPEGVLAWQSEGGGTSPSRLVWRDRKGQELSEVGESNASMRGLRLSPSGDHAVVSQVDPSSGRWDLWVYEMTRGLGSRFTLDPADEGGGVWSPDGESLAFLSNRPEAKGVYLKSLGSSAEGELLYPSARSAFLSAWHPDGQVIAFGQNTEPGNSDIFLLPLSGDREARALIQTPFREGDAVFSPDGRWVAYQSDVSGQWHVYLEPFPERGRRQQVSTSPARFPRWRGDGREIVYQTQAGNFAAAPIEARGETLEVGAEVELFEVPDGTRFDLAPDGQSLLLVEPVEAEEAQSPISVLVNWPAVLAER